MTEEELRIASKESKILSLQAKMQTGVAFTQQADWENSGIHPLIARQLKHLRVGINTVMCDHGALVQLLVDNGLITHEEYLDKRIEYFEQEVLMYTEELKKRHGVNITMGEAGSFQ